MDVEHQMRHSTPGSFQQSNGIQRLLEQWLFGNTRKALRVRVVLLLLVFAMLFIFSIWGLALRSVTSIVFLPFGETQFMMPMPAYPHAGDTQPQLRTRMVFTLTTRPGNEDKLLETLMSLADQSRPFDHGYIALPGRPMRPAPDLSQVTQHVPITVLRPEHDVGPLAKVLHTLEAESVREADRSDKEGEAWSIPSDTLVVTADDDQVYQRNLAETLEYHAYRNFGAAVSPCAWGIARWPFVADGWLLSMGAPWWARSTHGMLVDVLQGFCGATYRVGHFNLTRLAEPPAACRTVDDIWISFNLALNGVPRMLLPKGSGQYNIDEPVKPQWWLEKKASESGPETLSGGNSRLHKHERCIEYLESVYGPWPDEHAVNFLRAAYFH